MVDSLRRSIEGLEAPTCPGCHIDMKWYRSFLASQSPLIITHFFACSNCNRISETQTVVKGDAAPPPKKLSAPPNRFMCAA